MAPDPQHRLMLQILIDSAWVDHHLSHPEVAYLQKVLERYHLSQDPELQALLTTAVPLEQTERWIIAFFQQVSNPERLKLLATMGQLLIADDEVSDLEHDLIDAYHTLMAQIPDHPDYPEQVTHVIQTIGQYVRQALQGLVKLTSE
ncbi:MAG: TerB family tellurite resistance protein [Acaryochloridaceae cyanobacterium SU_2_1]|nr:TerB family tellurite resistance protein [Acaryochloridaceae cyanobacterium SU_2_1]NJM95449.1 TerB family tellurite resistance protein [Acaryochloridaceae cyanobacterium CSU_5_19]